MKNDYNFVPITRSNPACEGIIPIAVDQLERNLTRSSASMRGFVLLCHGKLVAEKYWAPYDKNDMVWVYSISKSFTSTAVGIAVMEGKINIDTKVHTFFPEINLENKSEHLKNMRIKDLLTMTTGHEEDTLIPMISAEDGDWVKAFFELQVPHEPGTHFLYNTGATFMLSAVLERAVNENMEQYLRTRMFEPLGFGETLWDSNPSGTTCGGWGIMIHLEDLAKLGQLYLNKGTYHGKRIISEEWVELAVSKQSDNSKTQNQDPDWIQGYGFQFWRCQHDAFRADGMAGQYCIVMPKHHAVLAIMCETEKMQEVLDIVWDTLLPGFYQILSHFENSIQGQRFRIKENNFGMQSVFFEFKKDSLNIRFIGEEEEYQLSAGRGEYRECETKLPILSPTIIPAFSLENRERKISAYFKWLKESELYIYWVYRESPHRDEMRCTFKGDRVQMVFPPNVMAQYLGLEPIVISGRLETE